MDLLHMQEVYYKYIISFQKAFLCFPCLVNTIYANKHDTWALDGILYETLI